MPGKDKKRQEKITCDALRQTVQQAFDRIRDPRRANVSYALTEMRGSAFARFWLKCPSLLSFDERTKAEDGNLKNLDRIATVPSDPPMRAALDPVLPAPLRQVFRTLFETLQSAGVIKEYHFWRDHVIVTVDGVEHFASRKSHCDHCCQRPLRDGTTAYCHAGLGAVLDPPADEAVLPRDFEPILKPDGAQKNDGERSAAKRLCAALAARYPDLKIILVEDALYANAPHVRQMQEHGWHFILNVKPDSHASLEKQFAGRRATGQGRAGRATFLRLDERLVPERQRHSRDRQ